MHRIVLSPIALMDAAPVLACMGIAHGIMALVRGNEERRSVRICDRLHVGRDVASRRLLCNAGGHTEP